MASLMPLQKSISPWKSPPQLRPFIQQDFMKTLEKAGPQLTSRLKGDWIGLYRYTRTQTQAFNLDHQQREVLNLLDCRSVESIACGISVVEMHVIRSTMCFLCVFRHFLKSPNFDGWFRNRRREMTQKLEALHLEALCEEVRRERREDEDRGIKM